MVESRQADVNAFLLEAFRSHGAAATLEEGFVGLTASGATISGAIVSENSFDTHASVQLDVRVDIGPGRAIVESCGGIGANVEEAVANAKESFVRNALHVLLAGMARVGGDQVTEERWELQGGAAARVVIGPMTARGHVPGNGAASGWFPLVQEAVRGASLGVRTHWMRINCARTPSGEHVTEVLLDNRPWPALQARIAAFAWPPAESFYSVRVFLMIDRGFDTSRAVAVMHRLQDRPDEEIAEALVALGATEHHASNLVDFLPVAFARPVLAKLGVRVSPEAQVPDEGDGDGVRRVLLMDHPVFADAQSLADEAYAHGTMPPDVFRAIAVRSPELKAVNQLISRGSKPENLALSPLVVEWW